MGEVAEMMMDGNLCEQCGQFIEEQETNYGVPRVCGDCKRNRKSRKQKGRKNHNQKPPSPETN